MNTSILKLIGNPVVQATAKYSGQSPSLLAHQLLFEPHEKKSNSRSVLEILQEAANNNILRYRIFGNVVAFYPNEKSSSVGIILLNGKLTGW